MEAERPHPASKPSLIAETAPKSAAAEAYRTLAKEVLNGASSRQHA